MTETIDAVRREIVVNVPPDRAFAIFTADMTSWWPPSHHIGSAPIAEVIVEPRAGGRWFTKHEDGTETYTGFVRLWDPPGRLVVTWQLGADWKYHTDLVTEVEVTFDPLDPGRTRVTLEHRGLSAYGAEAAEMKNTFEQPNAWTALLAAYTEATA